MTDDNAPVVDLPRVARAMAELDRIAEDHPELLGVSTPEEWAETLSSVERGNTGTGDMADATKHVGFRLDTGLLARMDAFAEVIGEREQGRALTRTAALHRLLLASLRAAEENYSEAERQKAGEIKANSG